MKTNLSLFMAFTALILTNSAIGMDIPYEYYPLTQQELEDAYKIFTDKKGLADAEILEFATVVPVVNQIASNECKNNGKLSQSTLNVLLKQVPNMSRDEEHAAFITKNLIAQALSCSHEQMFYHKKNGDQVKQFRDYMYEKHNIKQ